MRCFDISPSCDNGNTPRRNCAVTVFIGMNGADGTREIPLGITTGPAKVGPMVSNRVCLTDVCGDIRAREGESGLIVIPIALDAGSAKVVPMVFNRGCLTDVCGDIRDGEGESSFIVIPIGSDAGCAKSGPMVFNRGCLTTDVC